MKIREAKTSDKNTVLKFCKNTFSWGDYIKDVWDYWIDEGNLFLIENNTPVGMCHSFLSKNQIWIEGIRIEPQSRRQGLASKLVSNAESLAIKNGKLFSYMLIDVENISSLMMAKNLNYEIHETWNFYSVLPKISKTPYVKFGFFENIFSHYVKSWRWLELDAETISSLNGDHRLVYSDQEADCSFAILADSEHFNKTLIVTLHSGSKSNTHNIISYIQNFGLQNNYERIQILTRETLPKLENLEHRISFHLMKKILN